MVFIYVDSDNADAAFISQPLSSATYLHFLVIAFASESMKEKSHIKILTIVLSLLPQWPIRLRQLTA